MNLYEELKYRGLIDNITSEDLIDKLNNESLTFYIGVDPTGASMHIGHYSSVIAMAMRLKNAGHKPIIIAGGGTGLIGDPKPNAERSMLSKEVSLQNIENIKKQLVKLLGDDVKVINNADWLLEMNAIDYLRDFGKHFNINYMLSKDTVKRRLDIGITYTEFSYMILQSIDFLKLYERENCTMQIGGQDQWGNITSGLELIRKFHPEAKCYGLTMPLITRADGSKFGKSESGKSLWLDINLTSSYEMYQYFVNSEDSKVIEYFKKLTFLSKEEIDEMEVLLKNEPEKRTAHKRLAFEVVKILHGEEEAIKAEETSKEVFSGNHSENMPTYKLNNEKIGIINIMDLLVLTELTTSKSEAKRLVKSNAVKINNEKVENENLIINDELFENNMFILQKGKKNYIKIEK